MTIKVENLFLLLAVLFGFGILLVNPLFRTPDEVRHFWRAYQVAQGNILPTKYGTSLGGELPKSITGIEDWQGPKSIVDLLNQKADDAARISQYRVLANDKEVSNFPNTALYSPVAYLGSALGIIVGTVADSPIAMGHIGRAFNLLIWIALCYLSIRIIPFGKYTLLILCLSPIAMQQAVSFSADVVTFALAVLGVAMVSRSLTIPSLGTKYLLSMAVVFLLLGFCKQPFSVLSLLILLVPVGRFGSKTRFVLWTSGTILASISATLLWSAQANNFFVPTRTDVLIQPTEQLHFVLLHPLSFFSSLLQTYANQGWHLIQGVSSSLGYGDLRLPIWATALFYVALILSIYCNSVPSPLTRTKKILVLILGVSTMCIISLMIYMSWSSVSAPIIEGLQGRYFLPLAALLSFFALTTPKIVPREILGACIIATVCLNLVASFLLLAT